MARKKQAAAGTETAADAYSHLQKAVQRPDVGVQEEFQARKPPKTYRYDSSLDPQLSWDENSGREQAEWLLALIERAAAGEDVFAEPQVWQGDGTRIDSLSAAVARLKSLSKPFLNWAGKAERHQISVPTVPLFIHERHSTKAILETVKHRKATGSNLDLFADQQIDIADKLAAYEHQGPWTNRLILGDSLQVMNSLLEYEGLGGQVQMIYMDPPYGVKFGSNFQPFVRKRSVSDKDEDMAREPETVQAYRDTWEVGLHSYLGYLRDRLFLSREMLTESGSIFVQINDDNFHLVRQVLEEVFLRENFVVTIPTKKKGSQKGGRMDPVNDYLIWYARNKSVASYNQLFVKQELDADLARTFRYVALADKSVTTISKLSKREGFDYSQTPAQLFKDFPEAKLFTSENLTSGGVRRRQSVKFTYKGQVFDPGLEKGNCWKHTAVGSGRDPSGMDRLAAANRLYVGRNQLRFRRYLEDFGYTALSNWWDGLGGASDPVYVVQTNDEIVRRCVLMTTSPGDLVFDPTCGSGTTAYVAEKWGRRWITCDTSRVPLALARQRLLTASYRWYKLADPDKGPAGDFVYVSKRNAAGNELGGMVPHITSSTIANDQEPKMEKLVDRPEYIAEITRVSGPFTVEATIPGAADLYATNDDNATGGEPRTHIDRMIEVLRQSHTLRLPGNRTLNFEQVRPVSDCEYLHAEAVENNGSLKRIGILFGPQDGAVTSKAVFEAGREAYFLKYDHLYVFGFAIQAKARELVEDREKLRIAVSYVNVTPDVVMSDLLKTTRSSEIFSVTGLPDIDVKRCKDQSSNGEPLYQVELRGLDIFNPVDMETESIDGKNLPAWMLDTDYNGLCFYASQVFFPKTSAWENLKKSLGANFEETLWEHLAGTLSEPFVLGEHRSVAVKVIDERGNELMVVRDVPA